MNVNQARKALFSDGTSTAAESLAELLDIERDDAQDAATIAMGNQLRRFLQTRFARVVMRLVLLDDDGQVVWFSHEFGRFPEEREYLADLVRHIRDEYRPAPGRLRIERTTVPTGPDWIVQDAAGEIVFPTARKTS